ATGVLVVLFDHDRSEVGVEKSGRRARRGAPAAQRSTGVPRTPPRFNISTRSHELDARIGVKYRTIASNRGHLGRICLLWHSGRAMTGLSCGPCLFDARLGAGAMGEVWRARHPSHATPFAVKLLSTGGQGDEGALWMEVRAIAALNHPGIVSIH